MHGSAPARRRCARRSSASGRRWTGPGSRRWCAISRTASPPPAWRAASTWWSSARTGRGCTRRCSPRSRWARSRCRCTRTRWPPSSSTRCRTPRSPSPSSRTRSRSTSCSRSATSARRCAAFPAGNLEGHPEHLLEAVLERRPVLEVAGLTDLLPGPRAPLAPTAVGESDPDLLSEQQLRALFPGLRLVDAMTTVSPTARAGNGASESQWLIALATALVATELLLARWHGARMSPADVPRT